MGFQRALLNSETAKQGCFCTPIFLAKQEKNLSEFFSASETGYMYLKLLQQLSIHINIESLSVSQRSPAYQRILIPSLRDSVEMISVSFRYI